MQTDLELRLIILCALLVGTNLYMFMEARTWKDLYYEMWFECKEKLSLLKGKS